MNTIVKTFVLAMVVTLGHLGIAPSAYANKPLDVDCDLLEATNESVNDFLLGQGIPEFNSLGDFYAAAILDDDLFDQISALVLLFSGGQLDFTDMKQVMSTHGKCGLTTQLISFMANPPDHVQF
jgi:hypothetical protein